MYEYEISKDIESFRDYAGLTETEFAQQLGMPRSTFHNWKSGKSRPTDSSLEIIYGYMYNSGYRINVLKEQLFKDRCAQFKQEYKLNFGVYMTPA